MRDAGGQLPKRRHLLRMDQARLSHLQFAQRRLSDIARRANGFFGLLPLGDVGINQHEATAGHGIATYLNDAAVGPRALVAHLQPGVVDRAAELRFEIGRDELPPISEIAEILGTSRPSSEEGLRELNQLFEIAVPGSKSPRSVEHDDTVTHVVEGHAQLGLSITQFLEQAGILDRDHRLVGEAGGQLDLLVGEGFDARTGYDEYAVQLVS